MKMGKQNLKGYCKDVTSVVTEAPGDQHNFRPSCVFVMTGGKGTNLNSLRRSTVGGAAHWFILPPWRADV